MKSWKEVPHLFANGKFQVRFYSYYHGEFMKSTLVCGNVASIVDIKTDLIARKIEDMSDEEIKKISWGGRKLWENKLKASQDILFAFEMTYLLSIGVYPFDQKDFDTGEVIDSKTLED